MIGQEIKFYFKTNFYYKKNKYKQPNEKIIFTKSYLVKIVTYKFKTKKNVIFTALVDLPLSVF